MEKKKFFGNVKWIVICRTVQSLLQLIIGLLSARYLGPANYGLINYAKSIVAFAVPVMQLGLNATLVKELIDHPENEGRIIGTSLAMGFVSGIVCIFSVSSFVAIFNYGESLTISVCTIYSISLLFQALELVQYWFHSKLKSKYPSMMMLCAYVVVSAYKIYLLITEKSVYWFAVVYSIEYGIIGLSLIYIYIRIEGGIFEFSLSLAKQLIVRSYPYIWASLMVTVFQNTDHIMLKTMIGDQENGFYSAAITCVGVCQYVYTAIIDSMRPVILASKKNDSAKYEKYLSMLYCLVTYIALFQGIVFTIFAEIIVRILYGIEFVNAVPVMRILVWMQVFSLFGRVRNIWLLSEEKQRYLWRINLSGALLNIAFNYILIPKWGASGAAFASLITQIFANLILGFFFKPIRKNNRLLVEGMNPRLLIKAVASRKGNAL